MDFDELLKSKKVLICCGSGGVGKTTLSAALGVRGAELGLKVMVLTIDPARRLATSLGLKNLNEEVQVAPGQFKGELYGSQLDVKKIFDDFIIKLAPNPEVSERVLKNTIYKQLSTALNGSQEYTALEKLLQVVSSGKYDLVILDTPPTKHAIDFLNAPVKIHTLFQDSIIKWFLMPFTTLDKMSLGLMNRGTKAAFKVFENIAGTEFLLNLTEFFASIRDWQKLLRDRTAEVHRLLTSGTTGFVLVTGFNAVKIEEARFFERSLKKGGYLLSAIVVNRAFPLWGRHEIVHDDAKKEMINTPQYLKLREYYEKLHEFYLSQQEAFKNFAGEHRQNVIFSRLPDIDQDVHDIESLKTLAKRFDNAHLEEAWR
ncbi:MAG: ArsA-related P-loop ATPase [Oligoflexia bacterium]|nr:ArsA-related P-loop ATPase [Oligoflexia bacterium]